MLDKKEKIDMCTQSSSTGEALPVMCFLSFSTMLTESLDDHK